MLKVRIVSAAECPKCKFYIKILNTQKYEFDVYDADADENESELNKWRITVMPVVQLVEATDDETIVWFQFPPGQFSPRAINAKKKQVMKDREKKLAQVETLRQMKDAAEQGDEK